MNILKYDALIVGAGPAGIFAALELTQKNKKVLIVDKGRLISERSCPIIAGKAGHCLNCPSCAVVSGWGGAGSASDGKLTVTTGFGGNLEEYVGKEELERLIQEVDSTFVSFGADKNYYEPHGEAVRSTIRRAAAVGIKVIPAKIRHIGTDASRQVLDAMYRCLKERCEILMETGVQSVLTQNGRACGVRTDDGREFMADSVIIAPGRDGSSWLEGIIRQFSMPIAAMPVDIGVRVEVPDSVCEDLTRDFYEVKCVYNTPTFDDRARTFCMNPSGFVVSEYDKAHNLVTVNGHSLKHTHSQNTNFAILVTKNFTKPFTDPIGYATHIARLANMLAGGGLLVQRLGDLRSGRRSTEDRIARGMIEQTGPAVPGDLSLVLPHRQMTDIIEFLDALNAVMPGVSQNDTLLYGVEIKLYSLRVSLGSDMSAPGVRGLYFAGDGAGVSRGIIQAAASGLVAARGVCAAL
jgi:uncharacterized FAD-dependent dehydrogenase